MSTLLNPNHSAAYDPKADRLVLTFRDGRAASVIELDPAGGPALINALMAAVHAAKVEARRRAAAPPPPLTRPRRMGA